MKISAKTLFPNVRSYSQVLRGRTGTALSKGHHSSWLSRPALQGTSTPKALPMLTAKREKDGSEGRCPLSLGRRVGLPGTAGDPWRSQLPSHVSIPRSNCLEGSQLPAGKARLRHGPSVLGQGWTVTWAPSWGRSSASAPGQETGPTKGQIHSRGIHALAFRMAGGLDSAVRAPLCPPRMHAETWQQPPTWPDLGPLGVDQSLLTGSLEADAAGGDLSQPELHASERGVVTSLRSQRDHSVPE